MGAQLIYMSLREQPEPGSLAVKNQAETPTPPPLSPHSIEDAYVKCKMAQNASLRPIKTKHLDLRESWSSMAFSRVWPS